MRILLNGACGHMGAEVARLAAAGYRGAELVAGADPNFTGDCGFPCVKDIRDAETNVDCIIDFSHHSGTRALLDFAMAHQLPLVLATTGQTDAERAAILEASKSIPLFFAANYSFGIALLIEMAQKTAAAMPDAEIEIVEVHHDRKLDAPSGTALAIAEAIQSARPNAEIHCGRSGFGRRTREEIGIHSIRMGNVFGQHEVIIGTPSQTITLKHEAHSRALFAEGALAAAEYLCGKPAGLYDMKRMIAR